MALGNYEVGLRSLHYTGTNPYSQHYKTSNLSNVPAQCPCCKASDITNGIRCLCISVIFDSSHVLRSLFPPLLSCCSGLPNRYHPFTLPPKDSKNFIPRLL